MENLKEQVIQMYNDGMSISKIAEGLKKKHEVISKIVNDAGIKRPSAPPAKKKPLIEAVSGKSTVEPQAPSDAMQEFNKSSEISETSVLDEIINESVAAPIKGPKITIDSKMVDDRKSITSDQTYIKQQVSRIKSLDNMPKPIRTGSPQVIIDMKNKQIDNRMAVKAASEKNRKDQAKSPRIINLD